MQAAGLYCARTALTGQRLQAGALSGCLGGTHPLLTCTLPRPLRRCPEQKVDAELSRALATLESEKEAAMKTLDAQVRTQAVLPAAFTQRRAGCGSRGRRSVRNRDSSPPKQWRVLCSTGCLFSFISYSLHLPQVEKLSADILGRVLPEGVRV